MKRRILFISLLVLSNIFVNAYALKEESAIVKVGSVDAPVYNVETTWGKMEFTYTEQINYIWDEDSHTYNLDESTFKWVNEDNFIDITNNSYMPIDVELLYTSLNDDVEGNFDVSKATLSNSSKKRFTLVLDGKLSNNSGYQKVGLINLKIS